ncbi:hypothetical protein CSC35_0726 [Enterobacter hormaechei]|nr:hypothetical protein CSC35_0726 [Enterobacter hormaechei]
MLRRATFCPVFIGFRDMTINLTLPLTRIIFPAKALLIR